MSVRLSATGSCATKGWLVLVSTALGDGRTAADFSLGVVRFDLSAAYPPGDAFIGRKT
jgi:hypothetical protein